MPSSTFSMVGAPASGKSYYLAALTWSLRRLLPTEFALRFQDADPEMNHFLNEYEERLFLSQAPEALASLDKTQLTGRLYSAISLNGQPMELPRPIIFTLQPTDSHPLSAEQRAKKTRLVVLYDNAGEHFQPGSETVTSPATQHLAQSGALCLLFDPTKDVRFRKVLASDDPQLREKPTRQEIIFQEAIRRIRTYRRMGASDRYPGPVAVIVTKYDTWRSLLREEVADRPWATLPEGVSAFLRMDSIDSTSLAVRTVLAEHCPEVVDAVEGFADTVRYFAVSALGRSPTRNDETGALAIRPTDIRPFAVALPLLWIFSHWALIPYSRGQRATEVQAAEDVQVVGDTVSFRVPGSAAKFKIPVTYSGSTLVCPRTGTTFHLPEARGD